MATSCSGCWPERPGPSATRSTTPSASPTGSAAGRALGECGLDVRAARVETLGAEAVDVFYVTDGEGKPLGDTELRRTIVQSVLAALGD